MSDDFDPWQPQPYATDPWAPPQPAPQPEPARGKSTTKAPPPDRGRGWAYLVPWAQPVGPPGQQYITWGAQEWAQHLGQFAKPGAQTAQQPVAPAIGPLCTVPPAPKVGLPAPPPRPSPPEGPPPPVMNLTIHVVADSSADEQMSSEGASPTPLTSTDTAENFNIIQQAEEEQVDWDDNNNDLDDIDKHSITSFETLPIPRDETCSTDESFEHIPEPESNSGLSSWADVSAQEPPAEEDALPTDELRERLQAQIGEVDSAVTALTAKAESSRIVLYLWCLKPG
jgi:hypothetical protein